MTKNNNDIKNLFDKIKKEESKIEYPKDLWVNRKTSFLMKL